MKSFKHLALNKTANKIVDRLDQFAKLKEIANRKNYPWKIAQLHTRIEEEYNFWKRKEPSQKLLDLERDLNFIRSQVGESNINKERVDLLTEKYGYGKSS
jgi:hypothetical protein